MPLQIRDAVQDDFPAILQLNTEYVELTSPMDQTRLAFLHSLAAYHRVAELDGAFAGFLFAMRRGATYPNANFDWFSSRYDDFLYIDRIVIGRSFHRAGVGRRLYNDIFGFARAQAVPRVCCEFNVVPLNEISERFHARQGFSEQGAQWLDGGKKKVSMQVLEL